MNTLDEMAFPTEIIDVIDTPHTTPNTTPLPTKTKRLPRTKGIKAPPPKRTPSRAVTVPTYYSKHIFLDDPTQTMQLNLDQSHIEALEDNNFLDTGLMDYLIQRSIKTKKMRKFLLPPACHYLLCKPISN
jgi:hypothetical protein